MKTFVTCLISSLLILSSFGLTPKERNLVVHAREKLKEAAVQLDDAQKYAAEADQRAADAQTHAAQTDTYAHELQDQIDAHQKNEQTLANEVGEYKPFWDQGHKFWGIGAIMLGLGLLFKHALLFLGILAIIVGVLSFFLPIVPAAVRLFHRLFE